MPCRTWSSIATSRRSKSTASSKTNTGASRSTSKLGTLRVWGTDRHGIVATCTQVLGDYNCNLVKSEHWTDRTTKMFFQRLEFRYNPEMFVVAESASTSAGGDGGGDDDDDDDNNNGDSTIGTKRSCEQELNKRLLDLEQQQQHQEQQQQPPQTAGSDISPPHHNDNDDIVVALKSSWNWRDQRPKIGIMVSQMDHCLWELLLRHSAHELDADIHVVVSNHDTLHTVADTFGIPFYHTPLHATTMTKEEISYTEQQQLEILKDVDVVVLARYMQVLSSDFLQHFPPDGIINIHHSFLPAFVGGRPYHNAHERGVKLIGATAHYTTSDLDDGPIIDQDVIHVSHRDSVKQLIQKGRILERNVLLRALQAHLDDRTIIHGNKTIVFGD